MSDLSVRGHIGGFGDVDDDAGAVLGASALYRLGPIGVGGLLESGSALFGYSYVGVGWLAGAAYRPSRHVRLELLGSLGAHGYSGVGRGYILSNDPGADGSTAYGGVRAGVSYLAGSRKTHFEIGTHVSIDDDLSREVVRYQYRETGWLFSNETSVVQGEQTIGTRRTSIVLTLGATRDFL